MRTYWLRREREGSVIDTEKVEREKETERVSNQL